VLVAHACNNSYLESWDQEDLGNEAILGKQFEQPHLHNNHSKMDWRWGSTSWVPAL
jgi:hypothetical protein